MGKEWTLNREILSNIWDKFKDQIAPKNTVKNQGLKVVICTFLSENGVFSI